MKKKETQTSKIQLAKFFCLGVHFITPLPTFPNGNINTPRSSNEPWFHLQLRKQPSVFFCFLFFFSLSLFSFFFPLPARPTADASTSRVRVSLLLKMWRDAGEDPCNHFHLEICGLDARDDKYYQPTTMRRRYVYYSLERKDLSVAFCSGLWEMFAIFYCDETRYICTYKHVLAWSKRACAPPSRYIVSRFVILVRWLFALIFRRQRA